MTISGTYSYYGVRNGSIHRVSGNEMNSKSIQLTNSQLKDGTTRSSTVKDRFRNVGIGDISYTMTLTLSNGDVYTHSVDSKHE